MSKEKALIKLGTASDIGNQLDDRLENILKEADVLRGAREAYLAGSKKVEALQTVVDQDLGSGAIAKLKSELEVADYVKRMVSRAMHILQTLAVGSEAAQHRAAGKAEAMRIAVATTKKFYDEEKQKHDAIVAHEKGELTRRPTGVRPENKIAKLKEESKKPPVKRGRKSTTKATAKRRGRPKKAE